MAQPNQLNPINYGKVSAAGFDNLSGSGVCISAINADGTTRSYFFDPTGGNGFQGSISGAFLISKAATAATLTIANEIGTVCTITSSATAGTLVGATSFTRIVINRDGTLSAIFSGSEAVDAEALVYITYSVDN